MPLHHQYRGQARTPDGRTVDLPPPITLRIHGPGLPIVVSVSEELEQNLTSRNATVPPPAQGLALIDTGASATCVDETVAQQLRVAPIDIAMISSASHTASQRPVYPIRLRLLGSNIVVNASRAIGVPLQTQGFIALLGRDFLERFVLIYNGPAGEMTLGL